MRVFGRYPHLSSLTKRSARLPLYSLPPPLSLSVFRLPYELDPQGPGCTQIRFLERPGRFNCGHLRPPSALAPSEQGSKLGSVPPFFGPLRILSGPEAATLDSNAI